MATTKDLAKVNDRIQTVGIKGKDYAPVHERVKAFREIYPEGFITTEILSNVDGVCIIRAMAGFYDENGIKRQLGSGIAYEKLGSSNINRTSHIENCETSAIGRCLGSMGIGINVAYASANEVESAISQEEKQTKSGGGVVVFASEEEKNKVRKMCKELEIPLKEILAAVDVKGEMTAPQYAKAMAILNDKAKEMKSE